MKIVNKQNEILYGKINEEGYYGKINVSTGIYGLHCFGDYIYYMKFDDGKFNYTKYNIRTNQEEESGIDGVSYVGSDGTIYYCDRNYSRNCIYILQEDELQKYELDVKFINQEIDEEIDEEKRLTIDHY